MESQRDKGVTNSTFSLWWNAEMGVGGYSIVDVTPRKVFFFFLYFYRKVVSVIGRVCGDLYHVLTDRCKVMTHVVMALCDSLR